MKKIFLALVVTLFSVHAQTSITVHGVTTPNGDVLKNYISDNRYSSWNDMMGVSISLNVPLTESIFLSPFFGFDRFQFKTYFDGSRNFAPDVYFAHNDRGENTFMYYYGLEMKIISRDVPYFKPYLMSGLVYMDEKFGDIYLASYTNREIIISNQSKSFVAHSLGVGMESMVLNDFGVDLSLKYYSNYNNRFHRAIGFGLTYEFD